MLKTKKEKQCDIKNLRKSGKKPANTRIIDKRAGISYNRKRSFLRGVIMENLKKEDIIRRVREEGIDFIRMQFTDVFGRMKNVTISAAQIEKALDNKIAMDGSSIEGFTRIHESDQYLYPDLNSFTILPWHREHGKVARLICDVYNPDGTPFEGDPRYVLKRVLKKAEDMGFSFNVGPECEFFLFEEDKYGKPTPKTQDEAGYFDLGPFDKGEIMRQRICLALEEMGFNIEASHHESAAGQHEIDFKYAEALRAADNIATFKVAVKTLSQEHGFHATFMPKPIFGVPGSGMHTNMSLMRNGRNIFFDENGDRRLSDEAYGFIAGLLEHIKGMSAILNPLVNSYKRLATGFEAPCYVTWSASNRSALIRIPSERGEGTRVELRSPDPAANPYLALAVCLAAGLDGIERALEPPKEVTGNIYGFDEEERKLRGVEKLPENLFEAIKHLCQDSLMIETLGEHVFGAYVEGKLKEWEEYSTQVTSWEMDKYLVIY